MDDATNNGIVAKYYEQGVAELVTVEETVHLSTKHLNPIQHWKEPTELTELQIKVWEKLKKGKSHTNAIMEIARKEGRCHRRLEKRYEREMLKYRNNVLKDFYEATMETGQSIKAFSDAYNRWKISPKTVWNWIFKDMKQNQVS